MNSIVVTNKDVYKVEINGAIITFNMADVSLPLRYQKAIDGLNRLKDEITAREEEIKKLSDKKENANVLSEQERALYEMYDEMYKKERKCMDEFLGEGACQKIFGDSNWLSMFTDLIEALEPDFKKMGLSRQKYIESIESKYADEDEDI